MLPRNHPDRIRIVFDDHRLVANAGLLLPATLARHLGLRELVDHHLDLGGAPGRANTGDKLMTLVASAMAGGDCIDAADVLRTGGTACTLGGTVKAPSTLGTFLRSFRWGHVRQLDRVSRELLARAWAAGAGPGDAPFTIDLDSTICETYGLAKEGARHHGYTGKRGYHPLLAIAAGTGNVLMSRLREGPHARFPVGPLRHLQLSWLHHRPGRGDARTGGRPSPPRRDRECHPRPQARCGVEPSPLGPLRRQRRLAGGTGMAHNIARWTARIGLGEQVVTTKTLRRRFFSAGRTDHPLGAPPHTASATALALGSPVRSCPGPIARPATPCLTAAAATGRHPANRTSPRTRASPVCECLLLRPLPAISP